MREGAALLKELEIVAQILTQLKALQGAPFPSAKSGVATELPSWISAGDGASLIINGSISQLIASLANRLYLNKPQLINTISESDWISLVQRVIGPILGATGLDQPIEEIAQNALSALKVEMNDANWNFHKRTFLFGCSFIDSQKIPPFTVGPVTIRSRQSWLDHAHEQGRITRVTHRRLAALWAGQKLRARIQSRESYNEQLIIDAIGRAPYVCSAETEGLFGDFAKERALLATRLTLLGVALMWENPRKALQEINLIYDGPPYMQTCNYYQVRPEMFSGSRWIKCLHGLPLLGELWEPLVSARSDWWAILAEAIQFLLCDPKLTLRPKLMNTFAHALIWFHEACREPMPLIAITKFMSCLDSLACGRKANGIIALVSARMKVTPDTPIRPDGPTFKMAINQLYSEGRSCLLHGSSNRLGHDWENQMRLAETLARWCIIGCFHWAVEHASNDDPKQMAL